jgi:hypothetical protein
MRKEEVDAFALSRPFEPFEIRLVDGQRFQFRSPEQFIVARTTIMTVSRSGDPLLIGMPLIATIRRLNGNKATR